MGPVAQQLLHRIVEHRLDDRSPYFAHLRRRLERGRPMRDAVARTHLHRVEDTIDQMRACPNRLARAPSEDQLYTRNRPEIEVATLVEAPELRCGFYLDEAMHCVAVGTSGSGKTTFFRTLIREVDHWNTRHSDQPVVVIVLAPKGEDLADIRDLHGRDRWQNFSVHNNLRIGLQNPAGVPPAVWISALATSFAARAGLIAARGTLVSIIRFLLEGLNPSSGGMLRWPDFQLILDVCTTASARAFSGKSEYTLSLVQCLQSIVNDSGTVFSATRGFDVNEHTIAARKSTVISMPNLSPAWLRQFIADLLISQVLMTRLQTSAFTDRLSCLFIIDEADADCSQAAENAYAGGFSPIGQAFRMGRELGIGVCVGLAALQSAGAAVRKDAAHHYIFRLKDAHCCRAAAETLMLPRGAEAILPALQPGQCLLRTNSWPHAMLAQVDYVPPCRGVTPTYDTHPYVPAKRLEELPQVTAAFSTKQASEAQVRSEHRERPELSDNARVLLDLASLHPWWPVAQLWRSNDKQPSASAQIKARKELEKKKYADFARPRIGRVDVWLMEPTEEGWNLLGKQPRDKGGGGEMLHRHYANWIRMLGERRGYDRSLVEWTVPGTSHRCDAAWLVDGKWEAFEVVVSCAGNLPTHLEACFRDPETVAKLTIVAESVAARKKHELELRPLLETSPFADRVHFVTIDTYYKELWQ